MNRTNGINWALSLALLGFVAATALSIAAEKRVQEADPEQTLRQVEDDWASAMVKGDIAALDKILALEWQIAFGEGQVATKAQHLASIKSGDLKFKSMKNDEMKIRLYGNTAVITGLGTDEISYKGEDISSQSRFTDVLVKTDGRWQAVASHASQVAKK